MNDVKNMWTNYITFTVACYQLPYYFWYEYDRSLKNKKT